MDEILGRVFSDLVARTTGPMWFRLILQPLVAIGFGVHAGLKNARAGSQQAAPHHALDKAYRATMLRQALHDVSKVALIGFVLDLVFQWLALRAVYPLEAVLVVIMIVVLPYQIVRTLVARVAGGRAPAVGK